MNYNNFQQHQQPQTHLPNNAKLVTPPEGCKTLWAGDLHGCDENYVKSMFTHVGEVVSVKLIKDKVTHQPMGYGFIEFATPYMAQVALSLNGTTVGYTGRFYRLNWAKNIPNSNQNQGQGQQDMQMHHNQQMPMKQMKSNYMRPNQNMMNNSMQKTHHMPQMKMNQMGHMNQMNHMQMNQMYQPMVQNSPVLQSPQIVYQPQQMMPQQRMYPQQQVNNYQPSVQGNRHHEPVEIGEYSVFVGDLAPEVNDFMIRQAFSRYKSLASARVIIDPMTNISKMYGFVSFNDVNDYQSCLAHMGGTYIGSRPIKVNTAKKERSQLEAQYQQKSSQQNNPNFFQQSPNMNTNIPTQQPQNFNSSNTNTNPKVFSNISLNLNQSKEVQFPEDPNNTVLFIGSLSGETSEEDLFRLFNAYGEIRAVKISHNKDCGFVEYYRRDDAKKAFVLDGTILDGKKIFINWGTNPELKTYNPRFKNVREERTVSHIPVPNIYRQPNFQEPFDVQQSNQHYIQNNYPTVSCIPQEYLSQIVPSKNTYQNYYY